MTHAIVVPADPVPDGHQIVYWTFDSHRDGLIQVRLTYIENKTHAEVTGEAGRKGLDWIRDWRCESRYVPSTAASDQLVDPKVASYRGELARVRIPASNWNTNGRNSTEGLRGAATTPDPTCYATFAEARAALVAWIEERIAARTKENQRDARLIAHMTKLEEPAL